MLNNLSKVNMKVGVMTLDPNISSHLLHTPTPDYLSGEVQENRGKVYCVTYWHQSDFQSELNS